MKKYYVILASLCPLAVDAVNLQKYDDRYPFTMTQQAQRQPALDQQKYDAPANPISTSQPAPPNYPRGLRETIAPPLRSLTLKNVLKLVGWCVAALGVYIWLKPCQQCEK